MLLVDWTYKTNNLCTQPFALPPCAKCLTEELQIPYINFFNATLLGIKPDSLRTKRTLSTSHQFLFQFHKSSYQLTSESTHSHQGAVVVVVVGGGVGLVVGG